MKLRKKIIFQLCLILLISLLTACGQKQGQPIIQESKTDQIDTTEVENSDFINEIKDTSTDNNIEQDNQDSTPNNEEVQSQDKAVENQSSIDKPEDQLFKDCDEVIYAIDAVNIRASYSADSENLGILDAGQSITRTGTGINDADGWSRVQLTDGSTAYISSKYLSIERPATQQTKTESKTPSSTQNTSSEGVLDLDTLLSGLVDEDGFSIGHTDKDKDWSGYVSSEGYHSTGEQDVESWSHIQ